MRKWLFCIGGVIVFGATALLVLDVSITQPTPLPVNATHPQGGEQNDQDPGRGAQALRPAQTTVSTSSSSISPVWVEAETADALWSGIKNADVSDPKSIAMLQRLAGTCQQAEKLQAQIAQLSGYEKENALSAKEFLGFCAGFAQIQAQVTAEIERRLRLLKPRMDDLAVLSISEPKNQKATAVLVAEIARSNNPYVAREMAAALSSRTLPGFPLESWSRLLPPHASRQEREQIFGLAAEIVFCSSSPACHSTSFFRNQTCLYESRCVRGEDLLTYRRRTNAPILFQSAQLVADQITMRKYNIDQPF
jgi:hypothetical protein